MIEVNLFSNKNNAENGNAAVYYIYLIPEYHKFMKKKILPKTPASLFDEVENSPLPSPSPRPHSRTPTPKPKVKSIQKNLLLQKIIRIYSLVFAVLIFFTITQKYIPISYCENNEKSDVCDPCPNNAFCHDGVMRCKENAIYIKGDEHEYCAVEGTIEYYAKGNVSIIENLIEKHNIKEINDPHFDKYSEEFIRLTLEFSDKYSFSENDFLFKNKIIRKWPENRKTIILYSLFLLHVSIYILTYMIHRKI